MAKELDRVNKKLSNEKFVANAPEKIINDEKDKKLIIKKNMMVY